MHQAASNPHLSATVRRLHEKLEQLDALPAQETLRAVRPTSDDRFTLRIARHALGPIHANDIQRLDLRAGYPLDEPTRDAIAQALAREAARADALRLLRTRSRSRRDLANRLSRKGHASASASEALDRLASVGLLDDEQFASTVAERLASSGKKAPRAAEAKLRSLGLDATVASTATRQAFEGVDLLAQAIDAAHKRARTMPESLDPQARRRRLYSFLARRGYDHQIAMRALESALLGHAQD